MSENITENGIREIVHQAAGGDRNAMKTLMRGITSDMYFVTRLFINDRDQARSSEESALRNALGRLKESEAVESFEKWISAIVRDEAISRVMPIDADDILDMPYSAADEYTSPENIIAYSEEECRVRILHVLDELTPAERAAAALHFYEHLSPEEIADKLHLTADQAGSLITAAKQTIASGDIDLQTFAALTERVNPAPIKEEAEELILPEAEPVFDAADDFDTMELEAQPEEDIEKLQEEEPALLQDTSVYEKRRFAEETPEPVKEPEPVTIVDDDEYEDEDDEEGGHGAAFLKILLALLLVAAVCGGVYWALFVRNANSTPSSNNNNNNTPSEIVDGNDEEGDEKEDNSEQTPEPAPAPSPAAFDPNAVIGTAHINVAGIPIHTEMNEASETVGEAVAGADYAVYEVKIVEADIWYRLDEHEWIDTEESWVTYSEGYNG